MSFIVSIAKRITNYDNPDSLAFRFRKKRFEKVLMLIEDIFRKNQKVSIIDIGGTKTYWKIISPELLEKYQIHITIVNLPGSEMPSNEKHFSFLAADACNLSQFENRSFHLAHSNSVIEHVGDWGRMTQFANELKRVAEKYYMQTPNYWFFMEPHFMTPFFHWFPVPFRLLLISNFSLGHKPRATSVSDGMFKVESARLLTKKQIKSLFSDAEIHFEKLLFFYKSIIAIKK